MGKLTREKDWEKTKMGSPESWPPSIRPILSLLLNSKVPMFLFWGEDRICFYNDAYRPSLGDDGKHPDILGMDAPSAWPEIWETIQPLLKKVFDNGESLWLEDQLIPIYRNGQMEEVYWTFGYSPVLGDYGKIEGVFVTCTETTKTVTAIVVQKARPSLSIGGACGVRGATKSFSVQVVAIKCRLLISSFMIFYNEN